MAKRKSFLFSTTRWKTDLRVRALPLSARGVYFEILCALHETNENAISTSALIRLLRASRDELQWILDMLEQYGLVIIKGDAVCAKDRFLRRRESLSLGVRREVLSPGTCVACGSADRLEVDHIVPVSRGGGDGIENLQPLCFKCNRRKSAQTMDEFMAGRAG